jgi:hypothetical protein
MAMNSDWDEFVDGADSDRQPEPPSCLFPGRCVMPGIHWPEECATAEMMEQMTQDGEC